MYILSLSIKNLLRNKRKTFVLALLITLVSMLVFVANAIFEQTNSGLRSLFENYLTSNYLISENSEKINSIFGYEMPLVAEYEPVKQLQAFLPLSEKLEDHIDSLQYTPIISAAVRMEMGTLKRTIPVFGVESSIYFTMFPDISLENANIDLLAPGNKGILLNATLLQSIESEIKRPLKIGEHIQLSAYTNGSFQIRQAKYAGFYEYPADTEPFHRIALSDPQLVRELLQYTNAVQETVTIESDMDALFEDSLDDLFSGFEDDVEVVQDSESDDILRSIDTLFETTEDVSTDFSDIITWSFILVDAKEGTSVGKLQNILKNDIIQDTDVKLMDWSTAAGLSAQAPLALQISFNIGMAFIILGSVLVIVNGLVISVLERTNEIGTMRAMGAPSSFVKKLYSSEMILLIMFFTTVGILLGIVICYLLQQNPIILTNTFLVTLFGSEVLSPLISFKLISLQILISAIIAMLAWQYPVTIAIRIQPAQIMGKGI